MELKNNNEELAKLTSGFVSSINNSLNNEELAKLTSGFVSSLNNLNENKVELKDFSALITLKAYNQEDFLEQLESLDCYDLEWWKGGRVR